MKQAFFEGKAGNILLFVFGLLVGLIIVHYVLKLERPVNCDYVYTGNTITNPASSTIQLSDCLPVVGCSKATLIK